MMAWSWELVESTSTMSRIYLKTRDQLLKNNTGGFGEKILVSEFDKNLLLRMPFASAFQSSVFGPSDHGSSVLLKGVSHRNIHIWV